MSDESIRKEWMSILDSYGITEEDYERKLVKLEKKLGKKPSSKLVILNLFNLAINRANDRHNLKMIYYHKALFLNSEKKEFINPLRKSYRMELLKLKERGVTNVVKILSAGESSCESCRKMDGAVFTIDEALKKMPLPNKNCTKTLDDPDRGFCRCSYQPFID